MAYGVINISSSKKENVNIIIEKLKSMMKDEFVMLSDDFSGFFVDSIDEDSKTVLFNNKEYYFKEIYYNCKFYFPFNIFENDFKKLKGNLDVDYDILCEEGGNRIYINTDETHLFIPELYYIDGDESFNIDEHYFQSDENLLNEVKTLLRDEKLTLDVILDETKLNSYLQEKQKNTDFHIFVFRPKM